MVEKRFIYFSSGPSGLAATGNQSGLPTTGKHAAYYLVAARLFIVGAIAVRTGKASQRLWANESTVKVCGRMDCK